MTPALGLDRCSVDRYTFNGDCLQHAEASALYVEDVDLGEVKTRTVVSGLAQNVPLDDLQGQLGVFLCNLKPRTIQGVMSQAMLLCAVR